MLIIRGRELIRRVSGTGHPEVLSNGAVAVHGAEIVDIGDYSAIRLAYPEAEVIGSPRHVVCPGFVNAHHHIGITPFQLGSPDLPLELWIVRRLASRSVDPYLDTMYSAMELVASGVTTVQHLHGRVGRSRVFESAEAVIGAYRDIGMRVSYSQGLRNQNRIIYEDDDVFINSLPVALANSAREYLSDQDLTLEESSDIFKSLYSRYQREERVRIQLAPVNLQWCSDSAIQHTAAMSENYDVPMHMHLLETPIQEIYASRRTGGSAVAHLEKLGALGPRMTLGHGVWLTEADVEILAEAQVSICHNCSSNFRLRSGIAPLNLFRKHGIRVSLGIDEAGINDDRDFLQEMRLVLNVHRTPGLDPREVPSAAEVFKMGTEHGACTTPFGSQIGVLEIGRAADIILLDWEKIATPYLDQDVPLIDAVLMRAKHHAVDSVIVAGSLIYKNGEFVHIDRRALLDELNAQLKRPPSERDRDMHVLGKELYEEAKRFYSEYLAAPSKE